jgi:hypothetical protein
VAFYFQYLAIRHLFLRPALRAHRLDELPGLLSEGCQSWVWEVLDANSE